MTRIIFFTNAVELGSYCRIKKLSWILNDETPIQLIPINNQKQFIVAIDSNDEESFSKIIDSVDEGVILVIFHSTYNTNVSELERRFRSKNEKIVVRNHKSSHLDSDIYGKLKDIHDNEYDKDLLENCFDEIVARLENKQKIKINLLHQLLDPNSKVITTNLQGGLENDIKEFLKNKNTHDGWEANYISALNNLKNKWLKE